MTCLHSSFQCQLLIDWPVLEMISFSSFMCIKDGKYHGNRRNTHIIITDYIILILRLVLYYIRLYPVDRSRLDEDIEEPVSPSEEIKPKTD